MLSPQATSVPMAMAGVDALLNDFGCRTLDLDFSGRPRVFSLTYMRVRIRLWLPTTCCSLFVIAFKQSYKHLKLLASALLKPGSQCMLQYRLVASARFINVICKALC